MRRITGKFIENTSIDINEDVINAFEFIAAPDSVIEMISSSLIGKPALAPIVKELEDRFADAPGFPLNHEGPQKNAKNRRNVGWMVRFVMREYGYTPVDNSERTRIGTDAGSRYFGNAAVYHKTNAIPNNEILSQAFVAYRELTTKDIFIKKDDPSYVYMRDDVKNLNDRRNALDLSTSFICTFLHHVGFNNLISIADLDLMFNGVKVPCIELYESINNLVALFEMFATRKERGYHEIYGPYTDKAKRAFYALDISPEEVMEIYVFFTKWDAIIADFYNLDGEDAEDTLIPLDAPTMVIKTSTDTYWFSGMTCGYAGTGCRGAQDILEYLGVIVRDKYPVNKEIQLNRVLHYYRDNGEWKYEGSESKLDLYSSFKWHNERLFERNGNKVLVQTIEVEHNEPEYGWFHASDYFLDGIKSIEFIRREDAIKRGMVIDVLNKKYVIQIVVRDNAGKEIWMNYPFERIPAEERTNLGKYLESFGVDPDKREKSRSIIERLFSPKKDIFGLYLLNKG